MEYGVDVIQIDKGSTSLIEEAIALKKQIRNMKNIRIIAQVE